VSAYVVIFVDVRNQERYEEYKKAAPAAIEKYGGRYVVRGGAPTPLEGPEEQRRVVLLEFPSVEQATAFWHSQEYGQVRLLRAGAAAMQAFAVPGL
jgi:uncharacterized protein (DUF1330 family)